MDSIQDNELTKGQKLLSGIVSGAVTIMCGIVMLLLGLGVFGDAELSKLVLPVILSAIGLIFFVTSFIQKNTVSLWISFCFFVPALVEYLTVFTVLTKAQLYPLYIAIPAVSSFFTMFMSREFKDHFKIIIFFGVFAALFSLESSGLTGFYVVLPIVIVLLGFMIIYTAVKALRSNDNE